jgi:hypothetical protein
MDRPERTLVTYFSSIDDYRENHNKRPNRFAQRKRTI